MQDKCVLCLVARGANDSVCDQLAAMGWSVHLAPDLVAAHRLMREHRFLAGLLVQCHLDDRAIAQIDSFLTQHARTAWVGVFDPESLEMPACHQLILDHLFDHHTWPVDARHLAQTLGHARGRAVLSERAQPDAETKSEGIFIGQSTVAQALIRQIKRVAKVEAPVLICGESGSGKELAANAIHSASSRAQGPFVPVNCAAMQPSLVLAELFGYVKGAFTGAVADKRGYVEAAAAGTLFLDEIGDIALDQQTTLLRFLQEKTIVRVGSTRAVEVDVRVIAATHVDLQRAVRAGAFREDLYYRLNVLTLTVPPLRERTEDIELIAQHCFEKYSHEKSARLKGFSRCALAAMHTYAWPGNVRELLNRVRRAMVMAEGRLVTSEDLQLGTPAQRDEPPPAPALGEARMKAERSVVSGTLREAGRNVSAAARRLGVSRMTMYRLMAKHGLDD